MFAGAIRPDQMRRVEPPRLIHSRVSHLGLMRDLEARRQKYLRAASPGDWHSQCFAENSKETGRDSSRIATSNQLKLITIKSFKSLQI